MIGTQSFDEKYNKPRRKKIVTSKHEGPSCKKVTLIVIVVVCIVYFAQFFLKRKSMEEEPIETGSSTVDSSSTFEQCKSKFWTNSVLPRNNTRKWCKGDYINAIKFGAKIILEMGENTVIDDYDWFETQVENVDMPMDIYTVMNPSNAMHYLFSMDKDMKNITWQRGTPLALVKEKPKLEKQYGVSKVIYSITNHISDLDNVYYLTNHHNPPYFWSKNKMFAFNTGVFTQISNLATIFHYDTFWGLTLPKSLPLDMADIVRGYIIQRIMWDIDKTWRVIVTSPWSSLKKKNTKFKKLGSFIEDTSLIICKIEWDHQNDSIETRLFQVVDTLVNHGILQTTDMHHYFHWVEQLNQVNYQWPKVMNEKYDRKCGFNTDGVNLEIDLLNNSMSDSNELRKELSTPDPINNPTQPPTSKPSSNPTQPPTGKPSSNPTQPPTGKPSFKPTANPSPSPTRKTSALRPGKNNAAAPVKTTPPPPVKTKTKKPKVAAAQVKTKTKHKG